MDTLKIILEQFDLPETAWEIKTISDGLINSTYKITGADSAYILQKINVFVFSNVDKLMENIKAVTDHIFAKTGKGMRVVLTKSGACYHRHENDFYRMYNFVENSVAYYNADNPKIFYHAGVGFGRFQNALADFDAEKLFDVIADFHNTSRRLANFRDAVSVDAAGRAESAKKEIEYLEAHGEIANIITDKLDSGELSCRVTHNDTKLNNILFDAQTDEPICAIDLDTVMKGSVLYDFGDAIRYGANPAGELGTDAPTPLIDLQLYRAFAEGFLKETYQVLTPLEIELMPESVLVMTYELALRFLEDYLRGDVYFGEAFKNINLQRAAVQIVLCKDITDKLEQLREITTEIYNNLKN